MKRELCVLGIGLVLCLDTSAQESIPVWFNGQNGISRQVLFTDIDSASFLYGNTVGSFYMNGGMSSAMFSLVNGLDSISFSVPEGQSEPFPSAGDFDVEFSPDDRTTYVNAEEVIPGEDDPDFNDFLEHYTFTNTLTITYSGGKASCDRSVKGVTVNISGAHVNVVANVGKLRFVLKGSTDNGSFKIASDSKFRIDLSGVDITNPKGAAINIQSHKPVYLVLGKNTTNTLRDGSVYEDVENEDQKATLFSEGQLLMSGSGSLSVTSLSAHGICSDDYIRLRDNLGTLTVDAAVDGINAKERLMMYGGKVRIDAGDDGLVARMGHIMLMGGELDVTAVDNGVDATYSQNDTTYIMIGGGFQRIETTGSKGHCISCTGRMYADSATVQTLAAGDASKCMNCYGDLSIADSRITMKTMGDPTYNEEEMDFSSASGIRCRSNLTVTDSYIGVSSIGAGGKGFNCDGNIRLDNSDITLVSSGGYATRDTDSVKPRALECLKLSIGKDVTLNTCATHHAINAASYEQRGGDVFAISTNDGTLPVKVSAGLNLTGGMLYQSKY